MLIVEEEVGHSTTRLSFSRFFVAYFALSFPFLAIFVAYIAPPFRVERYEETIRGNVRQGIRVFVGVFM